MRAGRGGACAPRTFLKARGAERWTFRLPRRLPRGRYLLVARAVDADGAVERSASARDRNRVVFRVVR